MGKTILAALVLAFAIEFTLILFLGSQYTQTSLYSFLISPSDWESNPLIFYFSNNVFLAVAGIGIIAGLYFIRNDFVIYAALGATFFSFGINIYHLWNAINSNMPAGDMSGIIATLVCFPIALFYIMACLDFARGRD